MAGPLAALLWYRRRLTWLAVMALPLLYFQWQAPIRDVRTSAGDPSVSAAYYQPLLAFLGRQAGPPFRVEIPFTRFHWEAYQVAPRFPLARGWERQLDIKYNHLFYGGPLNAATYNTWLHQLAVRFVAVPDASLDFSAHKEVALIDRGLPYLRLVYRTRHWRVYSVANPTPIVGGTGETPGAWPELGDDRRPPRRDRAGPRSLLALLEARRGLRLRRARRRVHEADPQSPRPGEDDHRFLDWTDWSRVTALYVAVLTLT